MLASATVGNPAEHASRLTGLDVMAVSHDDAPRGEVALALWEPRFTSYAGENGAPVRRAASSESADLLADLVSEGVRTLAFVRSRRAAEQVATTAAGLLAEVDPSLPGRVASYRGGYLPEERREIEQALRDGRLLGLAATNALELGIDVSGLDAVMVAGFPGTRAAWWQQVGRAGRNAGDALAVLVARDDPLDTYLVTHPEALLDQAVEQTVFDPEQPLRPRPAPVRRRPGGAAARGRARRCSGRGPRGLRRRADRVGAAPAPARRGGTGPIPSRPTPSPTSAPAAAARSRWSRAPPGAWSAPSTPRAPTRPPTPARSTSTAARPGSSSRSTSTTTSR